MTIRLLAITAMTATLALLGATVVSAQQATSPPPAAAPAGMEKSIEGQIKALDATGKMLTLADGTTLTIPPDVKVSRADLKPGANVKVSYEEKGGQKIVRNLEVQP